jgi:preprotein translocase subunit SecG
MIATKANLPQSGTSARRLTGFGRLRLMNNREVAYALTRITYGVVFLFYGIGKFMGSVAALRRRRI